MDQARKDRGGRLHAENGGLGLCVGGTAYLVTDVPETQWLASEITDMCLPEF